MNILTKACVWLARFRNKKQNTFNHTAHKELWDWLARNPGKPKEEWPGWDYYQVVRADYSACFACEYAGYYLQSMPYTMACSEYCPLVWPESDMCKHSVYSLWYRYYLDFITLSDSEDKYHINHCILMMSDLAKQIRDLPVKKGVICH